MFYLEITGALIGLLYLWLELRASIWLWPVGIVMPAIYIYIYYASGFYADMGINVYFLGAGIYGWALWLWKSRRQPVAPAAAGCADRPASRALTSAELPPSADRHLASRDEPAPVGELAMLACGLPPSRLGHSSKLNGTRLGVGSLGSTLAGSVCAPATPTPPVPEAVAPEAHPITRAPWRAWGAMAGVFAFFFVILVFVLKRFTDSTVPWGDGFITALSVVGLWMLARKYVEQWLVWIVVDAVSAALYWYKGLYPTFALYAIYSIVAVFGYFKWLKMMNLQSAHTDETS